MELMSQQTGLKREAECLATQPCAQVNFEVAPNATDRNPED